MNIGNDSEETSIERLVDVVLRLAEYSPTIERSPRPDGLARATLSGHHAAAGC